jgi:hypothetical protein
MRRVSGRSGPPLSRCEGTGRACGARFAPSLDSDAADETRAPSLQVAEYLQLQSRFEEVDHGRSFANQCCISTRPEEGLGGRERVA